MIDPSGAPDAKARWRWIAIGLGLVLVTNLGNALMNAASLSRQPIVCVAAINDPALVRRVVELRETEGPARP